MKIKSNHNGIHILNRSSDLASKMKRGLIRPKDRIEDFTEDRQDSPEEYAEEKIIYSSEDAVNNSVHKTEDVTKKGYGKSKRLIRQIKQNKNNADKTKQASKSSGKQNSKIFEINTKHIKYSNHNNVKTVEHTSHTAIKTTEQTANTARKTAKAAKKAAEASAKASKKAAEASKKAAETTVKTTKAAVKATVSTVKSIVSGTQKLSAAIGAGSCFAIIVIVIAVTFGMITATCFGIFYWRGSSSDYTIQDAIEDIDHEFRLRINEIKSEYSYDSLEIHGSRINWKNVLAVYAVKASTDPDNAQEVVTMDESKYEILKDVFWDMHEISASSETKDVKTYIETIDENNDLILEETEKTLCILKITVEHKTVNEMKSIYGFNDDQIAQIDELLSENNTNLWNSVLYRVIYKDIVDVARSQLGNIGGQPYWSWYGFSSRVEWCACFVSWCANECGYISTGVVPKFAGCQSGVDWFSERGQWKDRNYTPNPGDIVFFDWKSNGLTGTADHVGIVEKVVDNVIYTIEGNSGDKCAERSYSIGYDELLGFGVPQY